MNSDRYDALVDVDEAQSPNLGGTDLDIDNQGDFQNSTLHGNDYSFGNSNSREYEAINSGKQNNTNTNINNNNNNNSNNNNNNNNNSNSVFSFARYTVLFDVETKEVFQRCLSAIYPRKSFFDTVDNTNGNGSPDMYGPFWIATTVILVLFFSSTVAGYVASHSVGLSYQYDFALLTAAAGLMYGYTFLVPVALYLALKYYKAEHAQLIECLCLYGYANTIWIPVSLVATAPIEIFGWASFANLIRWIAVAIGFTVSILFLVRNLHPVLASTEARTARIFLGLIVILHAGLALAVKLTFFAYSVYRV